MPRQFITVAQLKKEHGRAIAKAYEDGATVTTLIEDFPIDENTASRNTMVKCLGELGFPLPTWAQSQKVEADERRAEKRKRA